MTSGLTALAGIAAFAVEALYGGAAWADDLRGDRSACRSSIVGTYLTTIEDSAGEFAARSLMTFHRDGAVAVVDAAQSSGVSGAFSAQQGSYRCTGRTGAVATTVDFGFPPDADIARFDTVVTITRERTIKGTSTLSLFTPLATCNPFEPEGTCELQEQVDFRFTSVRVPAQVD